MLQPLRNGTPEAPALSHDDLAALTNTEIGRLVGFLARHRFLIVIALGLAALLFAAIDGVPWRLWLLGGAGGAIAIVLVLDRLWMHRRADFAPWRIIYVVAMIFSAHAVLMAVTGGIESPLLILFIPVAAFTAIGLGSLRHYLVLAAIPLAIIWTFAAGPLLAFLPNLSPAFWQLGAGYRHNAVYSLSTAAALSIVILVAGALGTFVRRRIERLIHTAAKARQEVLQTMRDRNGELLALSGRLAHELKNPLASIQGLSQLMGRKLPAGSKAAEQMAVLIAEAKRMGSILDEFLNFSRPLSDLALRDVRPEDLLADVELLHEGVAHQQRIAIAVEPGDAGELTCDPRKVQQILINLLQNALDATPAGGRISLRATRADDDAVQFVIEDDGPGLTDAIAARLFTPGATTKSHGSGLGLTIARALTEQHGGSLVLENTAGTPGGGCTARVTLPRRPPEASTEPPRSEAA